MAQIEAQASDGKFQLRTRARVAAHVLNDFAARPQAIGRADVPWSAQAITAEWLTAILADQAPGAAAEAVTVSGGSSGSSVRRAVHVRWNEAGQSARLPEHLFVKSTPTLLTRLTAGLVAPREGAFYARVQPELDIETPRHFWSADAPESGRSIHVFEDIVATRGVLFCGQHTSISRPQAESMIDLLATVHGNFHGSPRFSGDLAMLPGYLGYMRTAIRGGAESNHELAMTAARAVIPQRVMAHREAIWPALLAGLAVHEREAPTLSHSDVHIGNWYAAGADRMGLADWALAGPGHWSRDIAYMLSTALDPADRRAWERDLIDRYRKKIAVCGGPEIERDEAWTRYKQQMPAALLMWTPTLIHSPTRPDMQTEKMSIEMIRRITAAIDETDALASAGA
jgi:hypothetical protein